MKHTYALVFAATTLIATGCGQLPVDGPSSAESTTTATTPSDSVEDAGLAFRGSIVSAFNVTVDGVSYGDMEQFYTAEQGRLAKKVSDAGYSTATNVRFEAELGFMDLWRNMNVFILAEGTQGYMAAGVVDSAGSFSIVLPDDAAGDSYSVRANKRIKVKFSTGTVLNTFCYNFSAVHQQVSLVALSKPILLNTFESSLTAYDCPAETAASSIQIPSSSIATSTGEINPGMTKSQVSVTLGVDGLTILDSANWCYTPVKNDSICDVQYQNVSCRCSVQFDDKGLLKAQSNINSTLLKKGSWN